MNIAVLGAGAWGTGMALHLSRLGHRVTLCPRRMEHALELASARENRDYLPGFTWGPDMQIGCEFKPAVMEAEMIVLACPIRGLREFCQELAAARESAWQAKMVVTLCKGVEMRSLHAPSEIVSELVPGIAVGALSGPSNAAEVAAGSPTAVVLASEAGEELTARMQEALNGGSLRVYRSADLRGVELGGALKNIYAIGAGLCDGLRLGDNAKAALLTRSLHEMARLGIALGGQAETFYGLSGVGDLMATSFGAWSRNRGFGEAVGKGQRVADLLDHRKTVVEGYDATDGYFRIVKKCGARTPILDQIHAILYQGVEPRQALGVLLSRSLKPEHS
ncbi:NAD(P)-dependent glycerol-3-phosphate dehydrogenase [Ruficoccus amylovorans]|uniref:Glycerol-3-phosphate dehydrogenase [NAD(P)+] n=1 Tax=Ruficoccus amylovorans TaxID=1804625 RepID=A0A842HA29_9BACT|nr:NAD(P)H-dependent glycerol-3-phosphate dehydrogenase [Ruficoccus amylovorans]MBC2592989.1 NAD(P)-dependent glycerol-3-phosphate dehydrogenase [Ruficoccus amylovorans]